MYLSYCIASGQGSCQRALARAGPRARAVMQGGCPDQICQSTLGYYLVVVGLHLVRAAPTWAANNSQAQFGEEFWQSGSCLDTFILHSSVYIVSCGLVFVCPCGMPLWACAGRYIYHIVLCQGSCKGVGACTGTVHVPAMPAQFVGELDSATIRKGIMCGGRGSAVVIASFAVVVDAVL